IRPVQPKRCHRQARSQEPQGPVDAGQPNGRQHRPGQHQDVPDFSAWLRFPHHCHATVKRMSPAAGAIVSLSAGRPVTETQRPFLNFAPRIRSRAVVTPPFTVTVSLGTSVPTTGALALSKNLTDRAVLAVVLVIE